MAQSVEHIVHIDGVVGSSPTVTTREGWQNEPCQSCKVPCLYRGFCISAVLYPIIGAVILIHLVDEGYQFFFDKCGIVHPVPSLKSGLYLLSRAAFATDFFKFSSESGRTFCPFCQPFSAIFLTKKETGTCFSSSSLSVILIWMTLPCRSQLFFLLSSQYDIFRWDSALLKPSYIRGSARARPLYLRYLKYRG